MSFHSGQFSISTMGRTRGHSIGEEQLEPASRTLSPPSQLLHFSQYVLLISQHCLMSWGNVLSCDQKYLYRICLAIITGRVEDDLAAIEPGPPCVSRWNTLWSRICRVYVGSTRPTHELKRIVIMIIKFSSPMWFIIKCNPGVTQGPKNTFRSMQMLKSLNATEKAG